jgi:hypothetical protein
MQGYRITLFVFKGKVIQLLCPCFFSSHLIIIGSRKQKIFDASIKTWIFNLENLKIGLFQHWNTIR